MGYISLSLVPEKFDSLELLCFFLSDNENFLTYNAFFLLGYKNIKIN